MCLVGGMVVYLLLGFFLSLFTWLKSDQKIKAERCFCPQAFTPARRSSGPGFLPLFTSFIGEGRSYTVAVARFIVVGRNCIGAVRSYTATGRSCIAEMAVCNAAGWPCMARGSAWGSIFCFCCCWGGATWKRVARIGLPPFGMRGCMVILLVFYVH
jgi:hypothetical protein